MRKVILVFSLLVLIALVSGCVGKQTESSNCIKSGGQWKGFSDSCADTCEFVRGVNVGCKEVITQSCDCGPDKCWNGEECKDISIDMPSYSDLEKYTECINNLKKNPSYQSPKVQGGLLISFHENITDEQISQFVNSFKLKTKQRRLGSNHLRIDVPSGYEYYWVCKLTEEREFVQNVYFDVGVTTQ